jgi:glutamate/tyrosine decarboxylase-like PLP-dependent enzyme
MALCFHGLAGYRAAIEKDLMLAGYLASLLRSDGNFELFEPQSLSIVCFRFSPPNPTGDAQPLESLNREILEIIQLSGVAFLSSTVINDNFWLRACIVNPRATKADIQILYETLRLTSSLVLDRSRRVMPG